MLVTLGASPALRHYVMVYVGKTRWMKMRKAIITRVLEMTNHHFVSFFNNKQIITL